MWFKYLVFLILSLNSFASFAKTTTVMIYWAVDNDLYQFSIPYLNQFKSLADGSKLNLFLEYDYPGNKHSERFINFKLIEKIGERDSAHPDTLTDFIRFGAISFPADEFVVIIASHGSNWSGVIEDRTSNTYMSLKNLRTALMRGNDYLPSKKIDLLIFDACRMSYLETLFMIGDQAHLILGSAFDVNGFNHRTPLREHILTGQSLLKTAKTYVDVYPRFPGNREYPEIGASLLKSKDFLDLFFLSKFFNELKLRNDDDLKMLMSKIFYAGEKNEDWGFDLLRVVRTSGELFPELLESSLYLQIKFSDLIISSSVTPGTVPHSGLGLTCAKELSQYKKSLISSEIPEWANLCKRLRKFPKENK